MPRYIIYLLFFLTAFTNKVKAQINDVRYNETYKKTFNQVRYFLGGGRTGEAFVLLKDLYKIDSTNNYTNYLIGICYTEQNIITKKSYEYLEYASRNVMDVYKYIPYTEKKAPIYVWYYLTKAYAQNGLCDKALSSKKRFLARYGSKKKGDYFIKNINKFTANCKEKGYQLKKRTTQNIITQDKEYTTKSPIFSIQVGAFKELIPIREEFTNLKNVEAFLDTNQTLRYVVGKFTIKSQASHLLKLIKEKGYPDAFIVNVNGAARFKREVIIVDHLSFKAQMSGKVFYSVQIGAYSNTDSIPLDLARKYLQVEDIKEISDKGLTLLTAGKFDQYEQASMHKDKIQSIGILDAFVIALNNRKKVSLKAANKYLNQQELEKKAREMRKKNQKKRKKLKD